MSTIDECIHAVLDTNTFLHYQTLDQIHWCEFLSAGNVNLVIPHRCLIELNEKKDDPSSLYQRRANKRIKRLQKLINKEKPTHVRSNVTVEFGKPPTINYEKFGLDRNTPDCQIIALALEMAEKTNSQIVVVTDDIAMMSIVSNYSTTRHVSIPDKYKSQRLTSKTDKELERLRRENEQLKNQQPNLDLLFSNQEQHETFTLNFHSCVDTETKMQRIRNEHPEMRVSDSGWDPFASLHGISQLTTLSKEQITLYNERLHKYFEDYKGWLENDWTFYQTSIAQTIELSMLLQNSGTVPADGIEVHLTLSGRFSISDEAHEKPEPPKAPRRPRPRLAAYADLNYGIELDRNLGIIQNFSSLHEPSVKITLVDHDESTGVRKFNIKTFINKLKHHKVVELPSLHITLDTLGDIKGFNVNFEIFADNMSVPMTGDLRANIIIN